MKMRGSVLKAGRNIWLFSVNDTANFSTQKFNQEDAEKTLFNI